MSRVRSMLAEALDHDSSLWRRAMHAGIQHGPEMFVRYSPPAIGVAFAAGMRSARQNVRRTLRKVVGPRPALDELRDVAEVFSNFACSMTDAILAGSDRGYCVTSRPIGDWNFWSAAASGKGMIVATAHTAGWDAAGSMAAGCDRGEVLVVMERERHARAQQLHDLSRHRDGVRVVHVGADPLDSLPLLRHLRKGGIVAMKFDRVAAGMRTRKVQFFGEPWEVPEGPLRLASLTGAAIVPVFTRRLGFLDYQSINTEPLHLPRRPTEAQLDDAAQVMTNRLENFVRAYPTHWFRFWD